MTLNLPFVKLVSIDKIFNSIHRIISSYSSFAYYMTSKQRLKLLNISTIQLAVIKVFRLNIMTLTC